MDHVLSFSIINMQIVLTAEENVSKLRIGVPNANRRITVNYTSVKPNNLSYLVRPRLHSLFTLTDQWPLLK